MSKQKLRASNIWLLIVQWLGREGWIWHSLCHKGVLQEELGTKVTKVKIVRTLRARVLKKSNLVENFNLA